MTNSEHKKIVRDLVITAVASIQEAPKNATKEFLDKALGAVGMAADLGSISYFESDIAQRHLRTAAAWRGVRNFPNMDRFKVEAVEACDEFKRVWG